MANGKSTRDMVIEIHTNMVFMKEWITSHEQKHAEEIKTRNGWIKWILGSMIIPVGLAIWGLIKK